jgi:hypothetical protein
MGATRYPEGVSVDAANTGNVVSYLGGSGVRVAAGTVVVPTGGAGTAFASGLTTVTYIQASPYSTVVGVAGYTDVVVSSPGGGSVLLIGQSSAGTASTASGTASWFAIGT